MHRRADLSPGLGQPGGPCHVVQRINREVSDARLREELTREVESGEDLSNPDAAKVYDVEQEPAEGVVRRILIGPHAQYRMDLRGVTVRDVQATFKTFSRLLNDWKSRRDARYHNYSTKIQRGEKIDFTDPKTDLTVVFAVLGRDAKLITTWWQGRGDPTPPRACPKNATMVDRIVLRFQAGGFSES